MSTNNQSNGNPRPPSPPSLDDAELLRFVSRGFGSGAKPPAPPKPAAFAPAAAACGLAEQKSPPIESEAALAARVAAKYAAASADHEEGDEDEDGKLHSSESPPKRRHPCINRPVDHTYTDYASITDAELRRMDQDSSVLDSPSLSPEKKRLMLKLKAIPSKTGGASQSFPSKVC
jgi:hypothetical protein